MRIEAERLPGLDGFVQLKEYLIEVTGLAYYADRERDLAKRVAQRLERLGAPDCLAYLERLRAGGGGGELDALVEGLTVGETFFFRYPQQFEALRRVCFPDLIDRNRRVRRLRVWSAGCASGPEPYSVAILLRRRFAVELAGWDVRVLGTDINRRSLEEARLGVYGESAFRGVPAQVRNECFRPAGRQWSVRPAYREGVSFRQHNLVLNPPPVSGRPPVPFDLIMCRNVMIYFGAETARRLIGRFAECTAPGGWLVVGHAEPQAEPFGSFRTVQCEGVTLYQKEPAGDQAGEAPAGRWGRRAAVGRAPAAASVTPAPAPSASAPPDLKTIADQADKGRLEEALQGCRLLLKEKWDAPYLHFYHGLLLQQTGQTDGAVEALRRALYLDPGFVLAHYHLGMLAYRSGARRRSVRSLRNALGLMADMDGGEVLDMTDGTSVTEMKRAVRDCLKLAEEL